MKRNFILVAIVAMSCVFVTGCEDKEPVKASDNEKMDTWLKKGANEKGQRPWETGKPVAWGDEEDAKKRQAQNK